MRNRFGIYFALVLAVLAGLGIGSRMVQSQALKTATEADAIPIVEIAKIKPVNGAEDVMLPGTVKAKLETPIYARTSGYLKAWHADIGAHVKSGDVLAEIDAPEVDQQLHQAQADQKTAEANAGLAVSTSQRNQRLLVANAISSLQAEQSSAAAAAATSTVASSRANVDRLRQLTVFEKVRAPYSGTVTARETDVGMLINAGSAANSELFKIADTSTLRIYVQVPQSYAPVIKEGLKADLTFPEYPRRTFPATVVRSSNALDPVTRSLQVELDEDNSSGELLPGSFAQVHFKLPPGLGSIRIPANALIFQGTGLRVAVVTDKNRIVLKPVSEGRDFGTSVEIVNGLTRGDRVVLNPPASLNQGDVVKIARPKPPSA